MTKSVVTPYGVGDVVMLTITSETFGAINRSPITSLYIRHIRPTQPSPKPSFSLRELDEGP